MRRVHRHALTGVARHDVHVDVKHRLPGRRAVELGDLHAVGRQLGDDRPGQLLNHAHHLAQRFAVDIEDVARRRTLGDHQRMAEGLREQIEKGQYVVVFVELVARCFAANDLGENVLRVVGRGQGHLSSPASQNADLSTLRPREPPGGTL